MRKYTRHQRRKMRGKRKSVSFRRMGGAAENENGKGNGKRKRNGNGNGNKENGTENNDMCYESRCNICMEKYNNETIVRTEICEARHHICVQCAVKMYQRHLPDQVDKLKCPFCRGDWDQTTIDNMEKMEEETIEKPDVVDRMEREADILNLPFRDQVDDRITIIGASKSLIFARDYVSRVLRQRMDNPRETSRQRQDTRSKAKEINDKLNDAVLIQHIQKLEESYKELCSMDEDVNEVMNIRIKVRKDRLEKVLREFIFIMCKICDSVLNDRYGTVTVRRNSGRWEQVDLIEVAKQFKNVQTRTWTEFVKSVGCFLMMRAPNRIPTRLLSGGKKNRKSRLRQKIKQTCNRTRRRRRV